MDKEPRPTLIAKRESSFARPRFLGVPRDDQLLEDSSSEGILHGRTISEVHASDTAALSAAGYTWEQGHKAVRSLAIATQYLLDTKQISMSEPDSDAVIGFPNLSVHTRRGVHTQFHNPIRDAGLLGDPGTDEEVVQRHAEEFSVTLPDGANSTINRQTLYLLEAHHLMEKGNQYAMSGEQLVEIIRNFDENAYYGDADLQSWLAQKAEKIRKPYKAISGHEENITYADGQAINLRVNMGGDFRLLPLGDNENLIQFFTDDEANLHRVRIFLEESAITCEKGEDGWKMVYTPSSETRHRDIEQAIPEDSHVWRYIHLGETIQATARTQPDGLMSDEVATEAYNLFFTPTNIPKTYVWY